MHGLATWPVPSGITCTSHTSAGRLLIVYDLLFVVSCAEICLLCSMGQPDMFLTAGCTACCWRCCAFATQTCASLYACKGACAAGPVISDITLQVGTTHCLDIAVCCQDAVLHGASHQASDRQQGKTDCTFTWQLLSAGCSSSLCLQRSSITP